MSISPKFEPSSELLRISAKLLIPKSQHVARVLLSNFWVGQWERDANSKPETFTPKPETFTPNLEQTSPNHQIPTL